MLKNIIFTLVTLLSLACSPVVFAEDNSSAAATPPVKTESPTPPEHPDKEHMRTQQPIQDNHVDYRYCLELKSNKEIAECAYKNR